MVKFRLDITLGQIIQGPLKKCLIANYEIREPDNSFRLKFFKSR